VEIQSFITSPKYRWFVVMMLWAICFLNYADRQVIFSVFPLLAQEFGFSKLQLGLVGSSFMWCYAAASFFAGILCDRWSRKSLILGGCCFWSFVTMTTGWCSKFWQFVGVRALEGLGEVFYFPASTSFIADYHGNETRSTALSFHQSGVYLGTIVGTCFGAWIAQYYGWRYGFYFFGSIGVVFSLFLVLFLKEPARGHSEKKINLFEKNDITPKIISTEKKVTVREVFICVYQRPIVLLLILAFISANFVAGIFLVWMPTFLYEKFSMTLTYAGCSAVMTVQIASIIGVLFTGKLVDQLSVRIHGARVFIQMISLFLGAGAIVAVGMVGTIPLLLCAMIFFGFCKGGYDGGIFASQFDYVEPHLRGSIVGLMNTCGWSGGALGGLVLGAISNSGKGTAIQRMSIAISWSASIYLLAAFLLLVAFVLTQKLKNKKITSDIFRKT